MTTSFAVGPTLSELAQQLDARTTTSRVLVEECLARIDDAAGEGQRAYISVNRDAAIAAADNIDKLRAKGISPSRFAGIPISVKDLFDVVNEVTRAGSRVLSNTEPAKADATAILRLRRAGFLIIGRTNMTEFAFSGLGLNPHFGTPRSVWNRTVGHIPGGSSSGAAVSVADGLAHGAIGTDTGGSCRIPAAFNGIVGFKPTARRVPLAGTVPLSTTLDSIGPLGRSVDCCATLDAFMSGEARPTHDFEAPSTKSSVRGLRILVPTNLVFEDVDAQVSAAFHRAVSLLTNCGALIEEHPFSELDEVAQMNAGGGFAAPEAYAWHEKMLCRLESQYDPRVAARILKGREQSALDYIRLTARRHSFIQRVAHRLSAFDLVAFPTAPIVPPRMMDVESQEGYVRLNQLCLRNPSLVNMWDGCAISIPISRPGHAPVGLMLAAPGGRDQSLLAHARRCESIFVSAASLS